MIVNVLFRAPSRLLLGGRIEHLPPAEVGPWARGHLEELCKDEPRWRIEQQGPLNGHLHLPDDDEGDYGRLDRRLWNLRHLWGGGICWFVLRREPLARTAVAR